MNLFFKISFIVSLLLFVFTYFIDEEWVFEKYFSSSLRASISGFLDLHNFGDLEENEYGFAEALKILNITTETGTIQKIRNSQTMGSWPYEEVTYQLIGINELGENEKVLGEVTLAKETIRHIAEEKYKMPYINFFVAIRKFLALTAAFLGIIQLAVKAFTSSPPKT